MAGWTKPGPTISISSQRRPGESQLRYHLHGLSLCVESAARQLADNADDMLSPFAAGNGNGAGVHLRISHGCDGERRFDEAGLRCSWRQRLPGGVEASGWIGDHRRGLHLKGIGMMLADLERQAAELVVRPGREDGLNVGLVIPAICEFLGAVDQHACHAACLSLPQDPSRCVLLFGCSGAGKTTTALALHAAGLTMRADDCTVLSMLPGPAGSVPRAWGFPRPCKVHRKTFDLLGWLRRIVPSPRFAADEYVLPIRRLGPVDAIVTAKPTMLLVLQPRNDRQHRIAPMTEVRAVAELTRSAVRCAGREAAPAAARTFRAVVALAGGCPAWSLSVGPDLDSLPAAVLDCLEACQ